MRIEVRREHFRKAERWVSPIELATREALGTDEVYLVYLTGPSYLLLVEMPTGWAAYRLPDPVQAACWAWDDDEVINPYHFDLEA